MDSAAYSGESIHAFRRKPSSSSDSSRPGVPEDAVHFSSERSDAWQPPSIGKQNKRESLGDGYVDALQAVYPDIPPAADLVMIWWDRAAAAVRERDVERAGLITTSSITQKQNRRVVEEAVQAGTRVQWAAPDHPWVDEADGAQVRVAMTVLAVSSAPAVSVQVDEDAQVTSERASSCLNADLTAGADVAGATANPLLANNGIATVGFKLYGSGFQLTPDDATKLASLDPRNSELIRPFITCRDLNSRSRGLSILDFGLRTEEEAREWPVAYDWLRTRVKPTRDMNKNLDIRRRWWQLGHTRESFRKAIEGCTRYIVTGETSKHRFFQFLDVHVAPEGSVFCIALEDSFHLGVLSSRIHVEWAFRAAGRMGVGNDPRYNKGCFDPFPFPVPTEKQYARVALLAERLESHRDDALGRDKKITMTGMYNVLEKLRSGQPLSEKEREIHTITACGVLRDLHDELDAAVRMAE